MSLGTEEKQ